MFMRGLSSTINFILKFEVTINKSLPLYLILKCFFNQNIISFQKKKTIQPAILSIENTETKTPIQSK